MTSLLEPSAVAAGAITDAVDAAWLPSLDLEVVDELLTTTKSFRKRLDLDRPIAQTTIEECLQIAVHAPNASDRQSWRWLVITDPAKKAVLGDYYRIAFAARTRNGPGRRRSRYRSSEAHDRLQDSTIWLGENIDKMPALVIPCVVGPPLRPDEIIAMDEGWSGLDIVVDDGPRPRSSYVANSTYYGSIFPAVWSFMLALRSRGIGSTITTMHLAFHEYVADELGLPRHVAQICLLPLGYITGGTVKPPRRTPAADVTVWNEWGKPRIPDDSIRRALLESGGVFPARGT